MADIGDILPSAAAPGAGATHAVEQAQLEEWLAGRPETLRAWAGDEVPLADLATVELDLAALEREYERPAPRRLEPGARVVAG